jgi:hypothetical protein
MPKYSIFNDDIDFDKQIKRIILENKKIERKWLLSINAPVKQLPDDIAEAVCERVMATKLPRELYMSILSDITKIQRCAVLEQIKEKLQSNDKHSQ